MNPLPLVLADLRRNAAAAAALALLVALAIALGTGVSVAERALRRAGADAARPFDLLIGMPGSTTQIVLTGVYLQPAALPLLPGDMLARVAAEPGVAWAAPIGFGDSWRGLPIVGTSADLVTRGGRAMPVEGRVFSAIGEAVIGARVRLRLGDEIEPSHGAGHPAADGDAGDDDAAHRGVEYKIVGRMAPTGGPWDRAILVPVEAVWDIHGMGTGHGDEARVGAPWPADAPGVPLIAVAPESFAAAYVLRAKYRLGGTVAVFPGEVLAALFALLGDVGTVLALVAAAAQALVVAAILMVVFVAIAARRRQLAILRALGAPRLFVFLTVWGEIAIVLAIAGIAGLAVGWGFASLFAHWADRSLSLTLQGSLDWREVAISGIAVAAGLILAALPAATAYRRSAAADLKDTAP
jgi:putative ABC transport system permease protein